MLVDREGNNIDLALMYTCRELRKELQGLPSKTNAIIFQPSCTSESRIRAGILHATVRQLHCTGLKQVVQRGGRYLTEEMEDKRCSNFPGFGPMIKLLKEHDNSFRYSDSEHSQSARCRGCTPSVYHDFFAHAYRLLSQNSDFVRDGNEVWDDIHEGFTVSMPKPWSVLSEDVAGCIKRDAYPNWDNDRYLFTTPSDFYTMYAVATAIKFLDSLSPESRNGMR